MAFVDYASGSYRIRQGWWNANTLTTAYNLTGLPLQAGQTWRTRWKIPLDDSSVTDGWAETVESLSGLGQKHGQGAFTWKLGGLLPSMVYFLEQDATLFDGKASQQFTVQHWTRQGWKIYWTWGSLQPHRASAEPGFRKGLTRRPIDFVIVQDAPIGPDLTPTLAHEDPLTQGLDADYTVTVENVGDGAALETILVEMTLPGDFTFVDLTGTGWTLEYFESGMWVSSVGTPADVTAWRATYDSALAAGATSSAITLTINPDLVGNYDPEVTVTTSDDTDNGNDTDVDPTEVT
jgi:hypothetical protein